MRLVIRLSGEVPNYHPGLDYAERCAYINVMCVIVGHILVMLCSSRYGCQTTPQMMAQPVSVFRPLRIKY